MRVTFISFLCFSHYTWVLYWPPPKYFCLNLNYIQQPVIFLKLFVIMIIYTNILYTIIIYIRRMYGKSLVTSLILPLYPASAISVTCELTSSRLPWHPHYSNHTDSLLHIPDLYTCNWFDFDVLLSLHRVHAFLSFISAQMSSKQSRSDPPPSLIHLISFLL